MGQYFTIDSIRWALASLSRLPKDQTGILFYLIFAKLAGQYGGFRLDNSGHTREIFEKEFMRYFSGPLSDGTLVPFDPFSKNWRADRYITSTVFGRVINGSHWWTHLERGFISREPQTGWPAEFSPHPDALGRLLNRPDPPNLVSSNKISLVALTAWYYRFEDVSTMGEEGLDVLNVINYYLASLRLKSNTSPLIFSDVKEANGALQVNPYTLSYVKISPIQITKAEASSIFPPRTKITELRKNLRVFEADFEKIKLMTAPGEDEADVIRRLLQFYGTGKQK
jgi:hypothetical protein